jgi:hypothetical protein
MLSIEIEYQVNAVMFTEISVSCKVMILDGLRQCDHGGKADKLRHCASLRLEDLTET